MEIAEVERMLEKSKQIGFVGREANLLYFNYRNRFFSLVFPRYFEKSEIHLYEFLDIAFKTKLVRKYPKGQKFTIALLKKDLDLYIKRQ